MVSWQFWTLISLNSLIGIYVIATLSSIDNQLEKANQFLAMIFRHHTGN